MMKIALLSNASSIHTIRWANGLVARDIEVHLVSIHPFAQDLDQRVYQHYLPNNAPWGYVTAAMPLKKLLHAIKPDLLNAHYATGYGLLARLTGYRPLLLSVWGSDVFAFPDKSPIHRWLLKGNLRSATAVASTGHAMARRIAAIFSHPHIFITPFGVEDILFSPQPQAKSDDVLVVGSVKSLKSIYGIDTLIEAFALTVAKLSAHNVRLEITGSGPELAALQKLAMKLGVEDKVVFRGAVKHAQVPQVLSALDVYVALSRSESFGVAILEASACERPVVVSDAEGPVEVTVEGVTGFIVPKDNPEAASEKLVTLLTSPELRARLGKAGRLHVLRNYSWEKSLHIMVDAYTKTIIIGSVQQ